MIQHYTKVDESEEYDDKADEDTARGERLEGECHCPACHEPIGEDDREANSIDQCFLEISVRR